VAILCHTYRVARIGGARFTALLPTTPHGANIITNERVPTMTTTTTPRTLAELAEIVEAFTAEFDARPPLRDKFDIIANRLGVAPECTGNPATAEQSTTHTPKTGLSVQFYSVNPAHRAENDLLDAYYVAQWRGAEYRGHVVVSTRGYHSDNPNGFMAFDRSSYTATLPDGCRQLVAKLLTNAIVGSGVTVDQLAYQRQQMNTFHAVSAELYKAKRAMGDAHRAMNGGR